MRANPRRRHHRRRNPAIMGLTLPPMKSVMFAAVGFAGPGLLTGFLNTLAPSIIAQLQGMGVVGKYILKVGTIAGLYYGVKRFAGPEQAKMVLIGGGVNVMLSAVGDFAPGLLPAGSMMSYTRPPGMHAYTVPNRGLNGMSGMRAIPSGAAYRYGTSAAFGAEGTYGTAARFKRL